MEPRGENEPLAKRDYILFKHPSKAENSCNLLCYKPLAVLAIQRDNTEALIGTHQSQSRCNSSGVSSSQLLFKLLNNGDNIVRGLLRGALPSEGHIHKANSLPSQRPGKPSYAGTSAPQGGAWMPGRAGIHQENCLTSVGPVL